MVGPQSPAAQIFSPAQTVSAADVAAEGFPAIAAIEANHVIGTHRLANRDGRGECFFGRGLLSKLTEASVDGSDEVGKLTCSDFMVSQVTSNDFRGEWPMTVFKFHGSLLDMIFCSPYKPVWHSRILNFVIRNEARDHHRLWLRNVSRSWLTHPACSRHGTE